MEKFGEKREIFGEREERGRETPGTAVLHQVSALTTKSDNYGCKYVINDSSNS